MGIAKLAGEIKSKKGKMKKFTLLEKPSKKVADLKKLGHAFTASYTQRTAKIVVPALNESYLYGGKGYSVKEFHVQSKLKKGILEAVEQKGMEVPYYESKDIKYSVYSEILQQAPAGTVIKNVVEFDVNKAYYQCAYNLGYITKKMYETYLDLPKHVRLRLIGTIATRKRIYSYNENGRLSDEVQIIQEPILRRVWFHICKQVDEALEYFAELAGNRFLMYYVDGIYLQDGDWSKELDMVREKFGFEFKECKVKSITKFYNDLDIYKCHQLKIKKFDEDINDFKDKPFTIRHYATVSESEFANVLKENGYE